MVYDVEDTRETSECESICANKTTIVEQVLNALSNLSHNLKCIELFLDLHDKVVSVCYTFHGHGHDHRHLVEMLNSRILKSRFDNEFEDPALGSFISQDATMSNKDNLHSQAITDMEKAPQIDYSGMSEDERRLAKVRLMSPSFEKYLKFDSLTICTRSRFESCSSQ